MRSVEDNGDTVTVVHDDSRWARWFLVAAIAFVSFALLSGMKKGSDADRAIGCLGTAALFGIIYLAASERSEFLFDRSQRAVRWKRRRVLTRKEGTIPFDDIISVVAQTHVDHDNSRTRRITLMTRGGEIPLSLSYSSDRGEECVNIAAELSRMIGLDAKEPLENSIEGLVKAGRSLDAARLLRQERKISLGEAMGEIEKVKEVTGHVAKVTHINAASSSAFWRPPIRFIDKTTVERPAAGVWPFVIRPEYFRRWNGKISHMDATGEFQVGQTFASRYLMGGEEIQCLTNVAEIVECRLLVLNHTNCMGSNVRQEMSVCERITLKERNGRTMVRKTVTVRNHNVPLIFIPFIWLISCFGTPVGPDPLKTLCETKA